MNARVDLEVKAHLEAMHRELLLGARAFQPAATCCGEAQWNFSEPFSLRTLLRAGKPALPEEEILQPRRLSLRVF